MSASTTTTDLADSQYPVWNALLAQWPDGSIYSQPEYLDVLCRAGSVAAPAFRPGSVHIPVKSG